MMEPVTVNKDPTLINGSAGDLPDEIPPLQEPQVVK